MLGGINKIFSIKKGIVLVTIFSFFLISNQNIFGQCTNGSMSFNWSGETGRNQMVWSAGQNLENTTILIVSIFILYLK